MIYLSLKAIHIFAIILWVGGMLLIAHILIFFANDTQRDKTLIAATRQWDKFITTPAMAFAWVFGLWMTQDAGWWAEGWLTTKLLLVIFLSAVHGILSGRLKRLAGEPGHQLPAKIRMAIPAILLCALMIIILVVIKPF